MVDLTALEPQQISKNLRGKFTLIYGSPGCGKTTLASKFEKPLIASFEMGSNALNNVYVQPIKTWKDWKDVVRQLSKTDALKDKFNTIAIDTADEAFKLCEKWLCNQYSVEHIKDVASYGGGYKMLDDEFMSGFRELTYAGYGLLFISHEVEKTFTDDQGQEYTKIVPAIPNRPFGLINKMVDIISYIREVPVQVGDEVERKRFMFFRSDERFLTKSRFKYITPKIELDYNQFVDAIYDAIDQEVATSGGKATDEVNPYTKKDFEELLMEARMIWNKTSDEQKITIQQILNEVFEKETKFSTILAKDIDKLEIVLDRIRDMVIE